MKLSVSLPDDDVEFLDECVRVKGEASRSAVVHKAVRLLRATEMGDAYEDAWDDWQTGEDAALWDTVVADGLG
ncbi:MAG: ribbon-helix-helix domain-containing protein [Microthrixaceae bacterium]